TADGTGQGDGLTGRRDGLTGRRDGLTGRRDGSQRETAGVPRESTAVTGCPQPPVGAAPRRLTISHRGPMDAQDAVDERVAGAMVFLSGDLDRTSLERAVRTGTLQRLRRGAYGRVFTVEEHVRARIRARQQMTATNRQLAGPIW